MSPGKRLLKLACGFSGEILLASPYIKEGALKRVLETLGDGCSLRVCTRWRGEDFIQGASDVSVFPLVRDFGGTLLHHGRLHAKYFRFGNSILCGSANLTYAGMGWVSGSNLEILEPLGLGFDSRAFEGELLAGSVEVSGAAFDVFQGLEPHPSARGVGFLDPGMPDLSGFRPSTRSLHSVISAYTAGGAGSCFSSEESERISRDLASLSLPAGLPRRELLGVLASRLVFVPFFSLLREHAGEDSFERVYETVSSALEEDTARLRSQVAAGLYWLQVLSGESLG